MKIFDWENKIKKIYNYQKIQDIYELKRFLTNSENYAYNFCVEEITEGDISNELFYAAYVFNESEILGKKPIYQKSSGWKTTIVFLSSLNSEDIDDYYVVGMNGFRNDDAKKFFNEISIDKEGQKLAK